MFGLFKRKKNQPSPAVEGWKQLGQYCIHIQKRAADWLNQKAVGVPLKTLVIVLLLFCASMGACSVYLILQALSTNEKRAVQANPHQQKQMK